MAKMLTKDSELPPPTLSLRGGGFLAKFWLKRVNELIEDICGNGYSGIGKPEPLSGDLAGYWSRRINERDRIVYKADEENAYLIECRYHHRKQ